MLRKTITRRTFNYAQATHQAVALKPLPYELGSLEPVISGHLLELHYA